LPDRYVLHAEREEQLTEVGLDVDGITKAAVALARSVGWSRLEPETNAQKTGRSNHYPRIAIRNTGR
jgi:hypothetical protein